MDYDLSGCENCGVIKMKTKMKTSKIIVIIAAISFVILSFIAIWTYNKLNFTGVVTDKYVETKPGTWIQWKYNTIMVDSWFGNKRFLIEDDSLYDEVAVGETYNFKRTDGITIYVTIVE